MDFDIDDYVVLTNSRQVLFWHATGVAWRAGTAAQQTRAEWESYSRLYVDDDGDVREPLPARIWIPRAIMRGYLAFHRADGEPAGNTAWRGRRRKYARAFVRDPGLGEAVEGLALMYRAGGLEAKDLNEAVRKLVYDAVRSQRGDKVVATDLARRVEAGVFEALAK